MTGSIEGPASKLARAESQFAVIKNEIESRWHPDQPWPAKAEKHRGGLEHRFYLGKLPSVEPSWALVAGEIMFNLRCALDQLVWELHARHYRGRIPTAVERASQFPIFDDRARFREKGEGRIKALSKRDKRTIRFLQPYVLRNDEWSGVRAALHDLNTLHNIDKHRKLHVVASVQRIAIAPGFHPGTGFDFAPVFGPIKSGDHIDTWTFTEAPTKMHEHDGAYLDVVLEQAGHERDLIELLDGLVAAVALILGRFADRFPPSPHFPPIPF